MGGLRSARQKGEGKPARTGRVDEGWAMRSDYPISAAKADGLLATAIDAVRARADRCGEVLDALPAAIYTTDPEGRVTYYNPACVEFSGRTPQLGADRWCVTWKLYTETGEHLPHDRCPMALAIRQKTGGSRRTRGRRAPGRHAGPFRALSHSAAGRGRESPRRAQHAGRSGRSSRGGGSARAGAQMPPPRRLDHRSADFGDADPARLRI